MREKGSQELIQHLTQREQHTHTVSETFFYQLSSLDGVVHHLERTCEKWAEISGREIKVSFTQKLLDKNISIILPELVILGLIAYFNAKHVLK